MKKLMQAVLLVLVLAGGFLGGAWYTHRAPAKAAAPGARTILYYVDPMHPAYTSDKPGIAPDCGMELVPVYADGSQGGGMGNTLAAPPGTVTIGSETQQLLGVRVEPVAKAADTQTLRVVGRVVPDEGRLYKVNAGVEGTIREVSQVTTGSLVRKDQWLASFFSIDTRTPIQGYLTALDVLDRVAKSGERPDQIRSGDANSQFSVERLRNVGMSDMQIEELKRTRDVSLMTKIVAPADGYVLARNVSLGQKFDKGAEWYRIADLSQVWIEADVYKAEAKYFRPGLVVRVTLPDDPGTAFRARVSQVPSQFDATSRTLKLRLEVDNPGAVLRPDMFVDVTLPITHPPTINIPAAALLDSGLNQTVFVERGEGVFESRPVEIGWRHGDRVEIVQGLAAGERIAVSGTFLLDSESRMKLAASGATGHMHDGQIHASATGAAGSMKQVAKAFALAKDPVCGMDVDPEKALAAGRAVTYQGQTFYFDSDDCQAQFKKEPARFAGKAKPLAVSVALSGSRDASGQSPEIIGKEMRAVSHESRNEQSSGVQGSHAEHIHQSSIPMSMPADDPHSGHTDGSHVHEGHQP